VSPFAFWQCGQPGCDLRFPAALDDPRAARCPRCGAPTRPGPALPPAVADSHGRFPSAPLEALLDNIRSIHNVGSIFRTADGVGLRRLHLAGITPTPAHPRLAKAALGAELRVSWSYGANGAAMAAALREQGLQLWAVEATAAAEPLFGADLSSPQGPVALVVGNEKAGVDPAILAHCSRVLSLPMLGMKRSLNVAVAFGIAAYHVRCALFGPPPGAS
jgi:23S rRNA (guanosine2251-2'-O)-methyltransferase